MMSAIKLMDFGNKRRRLESQQQDVNFLNGTSMALPISADSMSNSFTSDEMSKKLVQPEVIDLDSDSDNYIFKEEVDQHQLTQNQRAGLVSGGGPSSTGGNGNGNGKAGLSWKDDAFMNGQQSQFADGNRRDLIDLTETNRENEDDVEDEPMNKLLDAEEDEEGAFGKMDDVFSSKSNSDLLLHISDSSRNFSSGSSGSSAMCIKDNQNSPVSSASSYNFPSPSGSSLNSGDVKMDSIRPSFFAGENQVDVVPQLSYTKLEYIPPTDYTSIREKIGDVQATVIPYYSHYSHRSSPSSSHRETSGKRPHFYKKLSRSRRLTSSSSSDEESPCDDNDGYYIIRRGSNFANGRFRIRKLLGQGTFGKVVKAYDKKSHTVVAIKIIKSISKYRSAARIELRVLAMLKKHDPQNIYQCIHLRDCFDYRGHICIVTDMLGQSLFDFMENNRCLPFPGSHIQAFAKQILRSVAFMHDLNLIHTDLKPENILLQDDSFVRRQFHPPLAGSKPISRKVLRDPKIFTIDFGAAIFDDESHARVVSTRHYRAPEIIMDTGWSFPCDLWSIGCILVELATGDTLFKTHNNVQHLAMMERVVGEPIDLGLVRDCIYNFYTTDGQRRGYHSHDDECIADAFSKSTGRLKFPTVSTSKKTMNEVDQLSHLEDIIGESVGFRFSRRLSLTDSLKHFGISRGKQQEYSFWYWFVDLVRKMLMFDPERRITAVEALDHEWFDYGILDDGLLSLNSGFAK